MRGSRRASSWIAIVTIVASFAACRGEQAPMAMAATGSAPADAAVSAA